MTQRWKQRPPGSTWGDWGEDDELGRINLLTPEKVLAALAVRGSGWYALFFVFAVSGLVSIGTMGATNALGPKPARRP